MSVLTGSRWRLRSGIAALALIALGGAGTQPALAQTRTLASLSDVPAYVPAPYHPHALAAYWSAAPYDSHPYYGGIYQGMGAHYWH